MHSKDWPDLCANGNIKFVGNFCSSRRQIESGCNFSQNDAKLKGSNRRFISSMFQVKPIQGANEENSVPKKETTQTYSIDEYSTDIYKFTRWRNLQATEAIIISSTLRAKFTWSTNDEYLALTNGRTVNSRGVIVTNYWKQITAISSTLI